MIFSEEPMMGLGPKEDMERYPNQGKAAEVSYLERLIPLGDVEPLCDSKLFWSGDRVTLTFVDGQEVASIHFDQRRREIFYRGHNLRNMTLSKEQWEHLRSFAETMSQVPELASLKTSYFATLEEILGS